MANVHTVSNQDRANAIDAKDLFLISQSQNENSSKWKSKSVTFQNAINSIERKFRDENFNEEIEKLFEVEENYIDDRELSFTYDATKSIIVLNTGKFDDSGKPIIRTIDASQFIAAGMIKSVEYNKEKHCLIITFKTADGKEVKTEIDISDILVLENGYGIIIDKESKKISIDDKVVSVVGHKHDILDVDGLNEELNKKVNTEDIKSAAYTLSSEYALSSHSHKLSDISNFPKNLSYFNNDTSYLSSGDFELNITDDNILSLDVGNRNLSVKIKSDSVRYTAGKGLNLNNTEFSVKDEISAEALISAKNWTIEQNYTTYDSVANQLSNDGYSMQVVFRDWE